MRRVSIALYRDLRNRCADIAEIVLGQFYGRCAQILVQPMQLRGSGNRNDPRFLSQQPGNRNLGRCRLLLPGNVAEHIHQGLIRFPILFVETRNDVAKVGAIELRVLVNRTGEKAFSQRTERDKANSEFLKRRQNLVLRLSPPK